MAEPTLEDFLKPIASALGHDGIDQIPSHVDAPSTRHASHFESATQADLIAHFEDEARKTGSVVEHAKQGALGPALTSVLARFGCKSVVFEDDPRVDKERIPTILKVAKVELSRWNAKNPSDSREVCAHVDAGVTFPTAGIAETGSLMQESSAQCGRGVSLLPPTYIAVVRASDIVPDVQDALDILQKRDKGMPSNVAFLTGPSTTSDIELVRVTGVHGPVHTAVIILDD